MTHSRSHGDDPPRHRSRSCGRTIVSTGAAPTGTVGAGHRGHSGLVADEGVVDVPEVDAAREREQFLDALEASDTRRVRLLKPLKTEIGAGERKAEEEVEMPLSAGTVGTETRQGMPGLRLEDSYPPTSFLRNVVA